MISSHGTVFEQYIINSFFSDKISCGSNACYIIMSVVNGQLSIASIHIGSIRNKLTQPVKI